MRVFHSVSATQQVSILILLFLNIYVTAALYNNTTNPATCWSTDQGLQSSITDKFSDVIHFNVLKYRTTMS